MNRMWTSLVLCIVLALSALTTAAAAAPEDAQIIILYENDVHCAVEGYSRLAAMKAELM